MGRLCWIVGVQMLLLPWAIIVVVGATGDTSGSGSPTDTIQLKAPTGAQVASFTGSIYWNTGRVVVQPPIRATIEGATYMRIICGFRLHRRRDGPEPPVEIRLRDPTRGTGQLFLKAGVDLSGYANATGDAPTYYDFDISAFDCDSPMHQSARVPVMLRVAEFEQPTFQRAAYAARLPLTAAPGHRVLQVAAEEPHKSARICRYEIAAAAAGAGGDDDVPFVVTGSGTVVLSRQLTPTDKEQHFALTVTAVDCSVPESRKASVPVSIVAYPVAREGPAFAAASAEETCSVHWMGIPEKMEYAASSGVRTFAGAANLPQSESCQSQLKRRVCAQTSATVKITVKSTAWSQECDRSVHSLYDQRRVCQVKPGSVDLLNPHYTPEAEAPASPAVDPPPGCKCCKAADSAAATAAAAAAANNALQPKLLEHHTAFNGVSYYMDVPAGALPDSHSLGEQFTLHFWLRHDRMQPGGDKEQILCSADEHRHNRHHYSVFLHNCKLILLLRREHRDGESPDQLRPAEWRFRLGEVCDSRWHHYAVSYSAGRVKLDVDGKIFAHSAGNPQVLEDYPMHRVPPGEAAATRLTVGACWHSADATYRQFFKGALAGLVVLRDQLESDSAIHCLNQCHDKLDFRAMTQLEPGMSVSLNADFTMIEIKGHNASEVGHLLRQIGYTNVRRRPDTTARRSIRLDTSVTCADPKAKVTVAPVVIDVHVAEPPPPPPAAAAAAAASARLCISGRNLQRYQPEELAAPGGVAFLGGLEISLAAPPGAAAVSGKPPTAANLDACLLRTSPDFSAVESLVWPAGEASDVGVEGRASQRDLVLDGYASPETYQRLLAKVAYVNRNPIIGYRTFVLTCTVRGGDVVSNEFAVKLSVLQPAEKKHTVKKQLPDPATIVDRHPNDGKMQQPSDSLVIEERLRSSSSGGGGSSRHHFAESHAAAAVPQSRLLPVHGGDSHLTSPGTPIAPIIVGVSTAGLLLVALGLMYLRYRRSLVASSSGAAASGGGRGGGKTLPVDAESQAEMEWDNSALNITVNPLDNEENLSSESGSEGHDDEYVEDELDLDGSSSCPEDDEDLDGMAASGLLMQRSAQIASSEDELDDEVVCQMVTGPDAVRYGQQQQQQKQQVQKQQLEWDDSSLPKIVSTSQHRQTAAM